MKKSEATPKLFEPKEDSAPEYLTLNRSHLLKRLEQLEAVEAINVFRSQLGKLRDELIQENSNSSLINFNPADLVEYKFSLLFSQIDQMLSARTLERARYYLKRLIKSLSQSRISRYNDLDLNRWQEYEEILTDSLWIFDKRDNSGAHLGWYWGNFIPQIPRQLMLRFTKKGEWVLDPFVGSGTTLIECKRLGRNGVGIELNPRVADEAMKLIEKEPNLRKVETRVIQGDSRKIDYKKILSESGIKNFQLAILHPPYFDIIKFSEQPEDLSQSKTIKEFLKSFGEVVENLTPYLEWGRYMAVVIGDKYQQGEWLPLGFYCMEEVKKQGYTLKGIIVKNFDETRSKRNQKELWRYRALVGGFYIFKHEYILLFKKGRKAK